MKRRSNRKERDFKAARREAASLLDCRIVGPCVWRWWFVAVAVFLFRSVLPFSMRTRLCCVDFEWIFLSLLLVQRDTRIAHITDRPVVFSFSLSLCVVFRSFSLSLSRRMLAAIKVKCSGNTDIDRRVHRRATWTIRHGPAFTQISLVMLKGMQLTLEKDSV